MLPANDRRDHVAAVADDMDELRAGKDPPDCVEATTVQHVGVMRVLVAPIPHVRPLGGVEVADHPAEVVRGMLHELLAMVDEQPVFLRRFNQRFVGPGEEAHLVGDVHLGMGVEQFVQERRAGPGGSEDHDRVAGEGHGWGTSVGITTRRVASRKPWPCLRSGSRWAPSAHSFQALMNTIRWSSGRVSVRSTARRSQFS